MPGKRDAVVLHARAPLPLVGIRLRAGVRRFFLIRLACKYLAIRRGRRRVGRRCLSQVVQTSAGEEEYYLVKSEMNSEPDRASVFIFA